MTAELCEEQRAIHKTKAVFQGDYFPRDNRRITGLLPDNDQSPMEDDGEKMDTKKGGKPRELGNYQG